MISRLANPFSSFPMTRSWENTIYKHTKSLSPNATRVTRGELFYSEGVCRRKHVKIGQPSLSWSLWGLCNTNKGREKHVQRVIQLIIKQPSEMCQIILPLRVPLPFHCESLMWLKQTQKPTFGYLKYLWDSPHMKTFSTSWGSSRILESDF